MRLSPLALVLAALALPATAQADSISFIKDGNVWMAAPDGSGQVQITSTGGYKAASQGDDGTLVAVSDRELYRLDRTTGAILNRINTPLGPGWYGPWEPAVSPDGTTVAYEIRDWQGHPAVAYSNTDGSIQSRPLHTGWTWPAWIDNTWLLHSEAPNGLSDDTIVRAVGSPNNVGQQWFKDMEHTPLTDVDIRGDMLAGVSHDGAVLPVYRFTGEAGTGDVAGCSKYTGPNGKFTGPALSPDARSLVWGENDGIWRGELPDVSCDPGAAPRLLIPGGYNPDWSPAGVPARPQDQTPPPAPPTPPAPPAPVPGTAKPMTVSVAKQKLAKALKNGLTVTLANTTAKTKVTATYKKKTVASGTGTTTVKLKFTKKAVKDLKRKKKVTLTLKAGSVTKTITLS